MAETLDWRHLKLAKEKFVSDLTGGSIAEITAVTAVGLVPPSLIRRLLTYVVCVCIMGSYTDTDKSN